MNQFNQAGRPPAQTRPGGNNSSAAQPVMGGNPFQGNPANLSQFQQQVGMGNPQMPLNHPLNCPPIQFRPDGNNASSAQQVMGVNPFQSNPANLALLQQQMGMINPQILLNNLQAFSSPQMRPANNSSTAQPAVGVNPFQGNPANLAQFQQQMGMINPQIQILFNNFIATQLCNRPPHSAPSPSLMTVTNQENFPPQNGMLPFGQFPHVFTAQNMNLVNSNQPNGQFFAQTSMNTGQFFNPNASLPNGQLCLQNMGQLVPMPMPNYSQLNLPIFPNQVSQGMGPQNSNPIVNQNSNGHVERGIQEQQNHISPGTGANSSNSTSYTGQQQSQGNSPLQQVQSSNSAAAFAGFQGSPNSNFVNNLSNRSETSQSQSFTRHQNNGAPQRKGFKSQLYQAQNTNGKFRFNGERGGKGHNNAIKLGHSSFTKQTPGEKKSLSLNYTEEEIKQWRENRKKNYPSKANIEKKLTGNHGTESADNDAELRRQQLKDILAKQAELGCEVAEVPSSYLLDSEKPENKNGKGNEREFRKKGRFQNKFNKRGKVFQNDCFAKKQKSGQHESSSADIENENFDSRKNQKVVGNGTPTGAKTKKREPTLLQKLLTADLKREKSHLLQVFRFMVLNSFFKDSSEPLRFPSIVVREGGGNGVDVVEEKSTPAVNNDQKIEDGIEEVAVLEEEGEIVD